MSRNPSRFVSKHPSSMISVWNSHVSAIGHGIRAYSLLADCAIPRTQKEYYFEMKLVNGNLAAIGVAPENANIDQLPGLGLNQGYGFSIPSGTLFQQQTSGNMEGSRIVNGYGCLYAQVKNCPDIKEGDVIGCCMNSENGSCFFTLNGMKLEPKITNINMNNQYYPIVALERGASLEVNFGDHPFIFQEANKVQLDSRLDLFADQLKAKFKNNISSPAKSFCDYLNDVTLVAKDGQEFGCHRLILSIRSDVFKAMFEPEKKTGSVVHIREFDGTTVKNMIRFIYSDDIADFKSEVNMDLYAIAHKYQLGRLQRMCLEKLRVEVNVENVLHSWMAASLFEATKFAKFCEVFIKENWNVIQSTNTLAEMEKENKDELIKLLKQIVVL